MKGSKFKLLGSGISPQSNYISAEERQEGVSIKYRHFISATLFIMASMIFCFYFIAFPLTNMRFTHGYPRFGTPPSPNNFQSDRYTWGWVFIYILIAANLMLPYLLAAAVVNNTTNEIADLHYFISRFCAVASIVVFVGLSVTWLFFCNRFFPHYSFCHDFRWCCAFFSSSGDAAKWCPNITPCNPHVSSGMLTKSDEFFQTWLFALLFGFWALAHRSINGKLRKYGLWKEVFGYSQPQSGDEN